jgi:AraC-like DNA-binding protein
MAVFPQVREVSGDAARGGGSLLFGHIDHFGFVDRRIGRMRVESLPLGKVTVAVVRSTGHDIALHESARVSLLMPLAGRIGVSGRDRSLEAAPDGVIVAFAGHRRTSVRAPASGDYAALVALAPEALGRAAGRSTAGRAVASLSQDAAIAAIAGYCRYLLAEWTRPDTPLRRPGAQRASEALLLDLFEGLDAADPAPARAAPSRRVRLAEEIMRARSDEPLTVEDLAREIGVGVRSLQLAFREHRGTSPRAALNALRLDRAREALAASAAASVTEVALASGFTHFGRFAAAYRMRFGEAPSETLRRARG